MARSPPDRGVGCMAATALRGHWLAPLALAWLAGLGVLQQLPRLPGEGEFAALLVGAAAAGAAAACWPRRTCLPGLRPVALLLAVALLAVAQGAWRAERRLAVELPPAWEARDLLLRGRIDSLPVAVQGISGAAGWRFRFAVEAAHAGPSAQDPALALPPRLLLSAYADAGAPGEPPPALRAGERWQFVARLKRPHGLANPHAFDYELWLFEQDLRATGTVRPLARMRLEAAPWWSLDAARQRLRDALQRRVADPGHAGVLAALSLGDQAAIARDDWTLFRDSGVAHLLSVSGLHVTMFAWAAAGCAGWLWRRSARGCLLLPAPLLARWAGVAAALGYALFSGFGVPAQRTVWMLASLALLRSLGLRWPWPLTLLAAAVVVTAVDPWALAQPGFWLSFAAVALLMAGAAGEAPARDWRNALRQAWRSQCIATLGLAPLSLLFFQQISIFGLLANLLAIPLVSFVITPLALGGALLPGLWLWAEAGVRLLLAYLQLLQTGLLPAHAVWALPVAPLWAQLAGLVGGALLVLPLPWRLRACGLALLVPLLWPAPRWPQSGRFELLAADVGQGTAVVVRTARHALLYDAGPVYAPGVDAGQRVLLPLLRALGIARLDLLLLSHRDSDHVGGAAAVLRALPVAAALGSLEDDHPLHRLGPAHGRCERGQRWTWDGVRFEVLHPRAADYAGPPRKPNAISCVLRVVDAAGRAALLTGDIEAAQEVLLAQDLTPDALRADMLLVPHHGSKTSSTDALLGAVRPRVAIVQAGYRNRFGHPALPVLARYQAHGIAVFTSAACGAWTWDSDASVDGRCERAAAPRYWRSGGTADGAGLVGPWPDVDAAMSP